VLGRLGVDGIFVSIPKKGAVYILICFLQTEETQTDSFQIYTVFACVILTDTSLKKINK